MRRMSNELREVLVNKEDLEIVLDFLADYPGHKDFKDFLEVLANGEADITLSDQRKLRSYLSKALRDSKIGLFNHKFFDKARLNADDIDFIDEFDETAHKVFVEGE